VYVADVKRRMSPRIPASIEIWFQLGRREVRGQVVQLNLSGFFAATLEELPVGELVRMRVALPDGLEPLRCTGWIRNRHPERGGVGVQLFAMSKPWLDRWAAYYHVRRRALALEPAREARPA